MIISNIACQLSIFVSQSDPIITPPKLLFVIDYFTTSSHCKIVDRDERKKKGGNQLINHNLVEDSISRSPITDAKVIKSTF